jgi:PKD repeat protein
MEVSFKPINYGGISSYSWNFGDGSSPVSDSNPTHTYDSIGVFSCTLSVIGGCGSKVIGYDSLITINACPIARIGADKLYGCQTLHVTFADTTDYRSGERDSLFWWIYTNDTFVDSARSDSILEYDFTIPGKYVVWADVFSEGGTAVDTLDDTIVVWGSAFATFTANGDTLVEGCLDSLWLFYVDFEAVIPDTVLIESFDSLVWDFGDGKRSKPNNSMPLQVSHPYDSAGEYTITLFSYGQCADTAIEYSEIKMVCVSWPFDTVLAGFTVTPDADTAANIQGYTSDVFTFTDTTPGGMLGRTWDFGDDLSDTGMITAHQYADTGTYTVTLTVKNCCTSAEVTETVVIDTTGAFGAFRRYKDETVKR